MHVQNHGITTETAKGIANYIREEDSTQGVVGTYGKTDGISISETGSIHIENATYLRPEQESEKKTAVEQFADNGNKSVDDRRNQMAVLASTTSPEDYAKMQESGFSLESTDSSTVITVTDKIKAVLAQAGVDISIYGDKISEEQLKEITGSSAVAHQISQKLQEYDLPVTDENVNEMKKTYKEATTLASLNEEATHYLIQNKLTPSIRNLYRAEHSSSKNHRKKEFEESDFVAMKEQVRQIIEKAGLPVNGETLDDSKWLLENQLPLTAENLSYLSELKIISLPPSDEQVLAAMAEAVSEGKSPSDGTLLAGYTWRDQAASAMEIIKDATDEDLMYCIANEQELTISNLKIAIANRGKQEISQEGLSLLTAKRQLEEIRLAMTTQANYALLKKGIAIDTKPLVELVEDLKAQENQYYHDLLVQNGVKASEESINTFAKTTEVVAELKSLPAYVLNIANEGETLHTLHESGTILKDTFVRANESYEALMTAPRADMGDSMKKAFQNVDDILKDLQMETTDANRRAVRILAYNHTDITTENITLMKAKDEEVQRAFSNMTPRVTLEMIRRNINPMDMDIRELNQVAENIKSELDDFENERFEKFLWKLEQNQSISEEERNSYIGIYRLIAQVEKTDGAVIGSLVNQGADITMRTLLTAVRSQKKEPMDYQIDENFEGREAVHKNARIDKQVETAFLQNCAHDIMDRITPEAIRKVPKEVWGNLTLEQFKESLHEVDDVYDKQYATEQLQDFQKALSVSDDVYEFLERYELPNSIHHILAAEQMLRNPNRMFEALMQAKSTSFDKMEEIKKLKEDALKRFGEAIKTPEELKEAQETLAEVAEHVMESMIYDNDNLSTLDLRTLRMMNQQFQMCAKQVREETYMIPVQTAEGITGVSLKVIRGAKEKGLVDILFRGNRIGKIAGSFEAKENGISGMIATDNEETKKLIEENIELLSKRLQDEASIDLHVVKVSDLSMEHYAVKSAAKADKMGELKEEGEKNAIQTKRLYHIAESFIQSMQELMNP